MFVQKGERSRWAGQVEVRCLENRDAVASVTVQVVLPAWKILTDIHRAPVLAAQRAIEGIAPDAVTGVHDGLVPVCRTFQHAGHLEIGARAVKLVPERLIHIAVLSVVDFNLIMPITQLVPMMPEAAIGAVPLGTT